MLQMKIESLPDLGDISLTRGQERERIKRAAKGRFGGRMVSEFGAIAIGPVLTAEGGDAVRSSGDHRRGHVDPRPPRGVKSQDHDGRGESILTGYSMKIGPSPVGTLSG